MKRGIWYYHRKVPKALRDVDSRAPLVRISLATRNIGEARPRRDAYEAADNQLWGAMLAGDNQVRARKIYEAAVRRAEAMGFSYRPAEEVAELPIEELLARTEAIADAGRTVEQQSALLGGEAAPPLLLTEVYKIYVEEIATGEVRGKSEQQRRKWVNVKKRAVNRFVEVVGDLDINKITREHALKFWRYWQQRIAPKEGKATHTPSSGNREIGSLRTIYGDYFAHIGQMDRINPFAGLSFAERQSGKSCAPLSPLSGSATRSCSPALWIGSTMKRARSSWRRSRLDPDRARRAISAPSRSAPTTKSPTLPLRNATIPTIRAS